MRPVQLLAALDGESRSTARLIEIDHDGTVGVLHVLQCAIGEAPLRQLLKRVPIGNSSNLIEPPSWTPATAIDAMFERNIERGAIDTSLSPGTNFHAPLRRRRSGRAECAGPLRCHNITPNAIVTGRG